MKKYKVGSLIYTIYNKWLRMDWRLKCKSYSYIGLSHHDLDLISGFLETTLKAQATKDEIDIYEKTIQFTVGFE